MLVTFPRHIGVEQFFVETPEGPKIEEREVDIGQDQIFIDGKRVGYVNPAIRKLLFIGQVTPEELAAVQKAAKEKYGGYTGDHQPPPLPEEYRVGDGEEEQDEASGPRVDAVG